MRQAIIKFLQCTYSQSSKSKQLASLQVFLSKPFLEPWHTNLAQQVRNISSSKFLFKQTNTPINSQYQERNLLDSYENDDNEESILYKELLNKSQLIPSNGHQVYVIQPYVKWGHKRNYRTTPELMLDEAVALVDSLPKWRCVDKLTVPLESIEKKQLFGKGRLEELSQAIRQNMKISAVFVSVDFLRGIQRRELEKAFGIPIYDRYSIVLQIFKERAKTYEAKLQVAFAEIPYLKSSLAILQKDAKGGNSKEGGGVSSIGGSGESYFEVQRRLLSDRECKIKAELERIAKKRDLLKLQRSKREFPVVAIVGYTNCGKTTLIKSLTGEANIQPKDALFATLDVTTHACRLPCNLEVLLVDTVGFISDIPTTLIAAFNSTLKDALDADLIVHVQDVSHPDKNNQYDTVVSTLRSLTSEELSVINVANKIDKLDSIPENSFSGEAVPISATKGTGLANLLETVEARVLEVTERRKVKLRVSNGGEDYRWICKEAAVVSCEEDRDPTYLVLTVVLTNAALSKLRHYFPKVKISVQKV